MTPHTKKFIATLVIILVWLPAYTIFIVGLSWRILPGAAWYVELLYYALAGTLWIVPIGLSFKWMFRDTSKS